MTAWSNWDWAAIAFALVFTATWGCLLAANVRRGPRAPGGGYGLAAGLLGTLGGVAAGMAWLIELQMRGDRNLARTEPAVLASMTMGVVLFLAGGLAPLLALLALRRAWAAVDELPGAPDAGGTKVEEDTADDGTAALDAPAGPTP